MILKIRAESELLRVNASGEFSLEEAERTFLEMLEAVVRHRSEKVLFDGREIQGNPLTIQRFLYGEFAANSVARYRTDHDLPRTPQFAYVLQEPVLDPRRFGETVAVNRGMWVRVFDNLEAALRWLGSAPANQPEADDPGRRIGSDCPLEGGFD